MKIQQPYELREEFRDVLTNNILPYWMKLMTDPHEGYYGRRDGCDKLHPEAERGVILNARILWTFSAVYQALGDQEYLDAARRSFEYIENRFIDRNYGGVFWSLNPDNTPADTKKQTYALAFTLFGLAEYYRASGDADALGLAIELFGTMESHCRDHVNGGYIEALTRDWKPIDDMRLSDKDWNAAKTMNTHLHVLEAYTALHRAAPYGELRTSIRELIDLFLTKIINPTNHHQGLFYTADWKRLDNEISYGHDIEASWLLLEAAREIEHDQPEGFYNTVLDATRHLALAALEGYCTDGSMIYERHGNGHYDDEKHWWVQAETVVGLLWLAKYHENNLKSLPEHPADLAMKTWRYIADNLVDNYMGEWYWSRMPDGSVNRRDDKAGFWKCPYHNSRMCLQAMEILHRHA